MTTFDDLPAELRNNVYEQLLHGCYPQRTHTALPLLAVSKQISQEATSYFHQNNSFAITATSPTSESAMTLPPLADKWLRFLRRLAVYATIASANSERERKIASTIASLATIDAIFEDLYIRIDSSLSTLANSRVDDSVLHAQHPITIALRQLLDANVAKLIRLELHGVWFAPGIAQDFHTRYGAQLQFVAANRPVMDLYTLERILTGSFVSSHLNTLGVDDQVITDACPFDQESAPSTPCSLSSSVCSVFQDLDTFSVMSFELNPDTTADVEDSTDDVDENSFFAGVDIEEWEASTQAAEEEVSQSRDDMEIDEVWDADEDEDEGMEEISEDDMEAIIGNMKDAADHIANDMDISYLTNFAPDLLLSRHNLGHLA